MLSGYQLVCLRVRVHSNYTHALCIGSKGFFVRVVSRREEKTTANASESSVFDCRLKTLCVAIWICRFVLVNCREFVERQTLEVIDPREEEQR